MTINTIKAFIYGFIFYGGIPVVMDFPFYASIDNEPIWGLKFTLMWGAAGGATFIVAWFSLYLLWKIYKTLTTTK